MRCMEDDQGSTAGEDGGLLFKIPDALPESPGPLSLTSAMTTEHATFLRRTGSLVTPAIILISIWK